MQDIVDDWFCHQSLLFRIDVVIDPTLISPIGFIKNDFGHRDGRLHQARRAIYGALDCCRALLSVGSQVDAYG